MSPDITHPLDDLAVYALDALDEPERALVDAHLTTCAACRNELDQHLSTLSRLTTPDEPPPELWDRIARQTAALPRGPGQAPGPDAQVLPFEPPLGPRDRPAPGAGTGPGSWEPRHRAPRRSAIPPRWLLAAAAVAVVLAGIAGVSLLARQGEDAPDTVAELAAAAVEDPDATVVTLSSAAGTGEATARVVTTGEPTGYVLLDDLPRLAEGHSYQLWRTDDPNVPVSLGVLGDGSTEAAAVAVPDGTTSFAITDEPVPTGVPAPTGPIVAVGTSA